MSVDDGMVRWRCSSVGRERARLSFRDDDGDGRWDAAEPGTLERRCLEDASAPRGGGGSGASVRVPSTFSLDESNHLDTFTFEGGSGVVVISGAAGGTERVSHVTELSMYTNVVIVRTRSGSGRIVPADRFLRAEWAGGDG